MNTIYFEKFDIPGADMGELNCLPDIMNDNYIHAGMTKTERISDEELPRLGKGMIRTLLPYQIQDGYNRERTVKHFDSVVLENEFLKARFVPELGGRLWSLFDKKNNKELLYKEGEYSTSKIWTDVHRSILKERGKDSLSDEDILKLYPLPYELDFRMH